MTDHLIEILLVEDNPNDVALAMHAFRKSNLVTRLHVARDGAEALDYLFRTGQFAQRAQTLPKVVLLDLKLPKIDGREVLQRLRADARTRSLPIVVLTSSCEERDIVESYQLGVNSYIVKPVDFEQFTEVVRQLGLYWTTLNQTPIESASTAN